jgi:hypothetical protein
LPSTVVTARRPTVEIGVLAGAHRCPIDEYRARAALSEPDEIREEELLLVRSIPRC